MTTSSLKKNLPTARQVRKLTQADLAKKTGLPPAQISHFERGERVPCLRNMIKLSEALGISIDALLS